MKKANLSKILACLLSVALLVLSMSFLATPLRASASVPNNAVYIVAVDSGVGVSGDVSDNTNPQIGRSISSSDGSITSPAALNNTMVWGMYPDLKPGTYYVKFTAKITNFDTNNCDDQNNIGSVKDENANDSSIVNFGGSGIVASFGLSCIQNQGTWQSFVIPLTITGSEINAGVQTSEFTIHMMNCGASAKMSIGPLYSICTDSTPLPVPYVFNSSYDQYECTVGAGQQLNGMGDSNNVAIFQPRNTLCGDGSITDSAGMDDAMVWGMYPDLKPGNYFVKFTAKVSNFDMSNCGDQLNIGYIKDENGNDSSSGNEDFGNGGGQATRFGVSCIQNQGTWQSFVIPLNIFNSEVNAGGAHSSEFTVHTIFSGTNSLITLGPIYVISTNNTPLTPPTSVNQSTASTTLPTTYTSPKASTISWPSSQELPSFSTPAPFLDAVNIYKMNWADENMMIALEGIVNRVQPRLILLNSNDATGADHWLQNQSVNCALSSYTSIIQKYKGELNGIVIYDPTYADQLNVANTLAGIYCGIIATPTEATMLEAAPYNLPVTIDLRTANSGGEIGTNNIAIYQWLLTHYAPGNTYSNPTFNIRALGGLNGASGGNAPSRDMMTALGIPVVWLDATITTATKGNPIQSEKTLWGYYLNLATGGTLNSANCTVSAGDPNFDKANTTGNPVLVGYVPNEGGNQAMAGPYGIPLVACDFMENYSVYSGLSRQISNPTTPAKPALQNKIYVAMIMSDGDNLQYVEHTMSSLWADPRRGSFPLSWTITPSLLDAAPQMFNYYDKTASANDDLISGPSGVAYMWTGNGNSSYWPSTVSLNNFAAVTNSYFEKTGLNLITDWRDLTSTQVGLFTNPSYFPSLMGATVMDSTTTETHMLAYGGGTANNTSVPIMYLGTGASNTGLRTNGSIGGTASYNDPTNTSGLQSNLNTMVSNFNGSNGGKPEFVALQWDVWNTNANLSSIQTFVNTMTQSSAGLIQFVRLDQLQMLLNQSNSKDYNVALNATATASSSNSGHAASLVDTGAFGQNSGWQTSTVASTSNPQYVTLDLGANYSISRYVLKNAGTAYFNSSDNTSNYTIQTSTDNVNWTISDTVTGNNANIVYRNLPNNITGSTVTARYVRISVTNAGADGVTRIQNFEVYGH